MGSAFEGLMAALGGAGNAAGIKGDAPGGLNALQRMALSPEQQAAYDIQGKLAALPSDPTFMQAPESEKFARMATITGQPGFVLSAAASQPEPASNGAGKQPQFSPTTSFPDGHPLNASTYMPGLVQQESGGNPNAKGDGGKAVGLGQLHPEAAIDGGITPEERTDPAKNLLAAQNYLQKQLDKYKDPYIGLLAYNWGPDNVDKWQAAGAKPSDLPAERAKYPALVTGGQITAPGQVSGFNAMPLPQQQPPEVTALQQSIAQMNKMRPFAPPEKWADIDGKIAEAQAKLLEFSPSSAGARTLATQQNTYRDTPQGVPALPPQNPAGWPAGLPPARQTSATASSGKTPPEYMAQDGKPIVPSIKGGYQPDTSGTPAYKTDNTATGVNQTKIFQEADNKANEALTSSYSSLQNEQFRLKELGKIYKDFQSGTLTAQNPDLVNKLIAWGVVKDPKTIKDVSSVQTALQNHLLQIISQIKDTNANLGGAPVRTFGSEINNLMEQGEDPKAQPEALWNIINQANGLVTHHMDMVKGWDSIGGLGNRAADGYTLRPDDYARKFIGNHDIEDYKKLSEKEMGPFKGMNQQNSAIYSSPQEVGAAFQRGDITREQAKAILQKNHGMK